jgi:hypothetical protein
MSSMKIGGVILFPMMSNREKDQKRKSQVHEVKEGLLIEGIITGGVTLWY